MTVERTSREWLPDVATAEESLADFQDCRTGDLLQCAVFISKDGFSRIWLSKDVITPDDFQFVSEVLEKVATTTVLEMQMPLPVGRA